MSKPRVFIGSSSEGLPIARAVQSSLYEDAEIVLWENDVFNLAVGTLEAIWAALDASDFGIFVLTEDDVVESRGREFKAPRDNVIFELGVFMGRLGRQRAFWLMPNSREIKVPTDLLGVTAARYNPEFIGNKSAMLGPACEQFRRAIQGHSSDRTLTWNEVMKGVENLAKQVKRSPSLGGFPVDVIIGLSGGGSVVSDILAKSYGGSIFSSSICIDRRVNPVHFFEEVQDPSWLNGLSVGRSRLNVLVVDDVSRTGSTISAAMSFLKQKIPTAQIRSAALISVEGNSYRPDYFAIAARDRKILTPFQV